MYFIGFCVRLNITISKISNLLLPLGVDGGGVCESWYTIFSLLYLEAIVLKDNADQKICEILTSEFT